MPFFSERSGIRPVKSIIQLNTMDEDLKNGLWNIIHYLYYITGMSNTCQYINNQIWTQYYKKRIDEIPSGNYGFVVKSWFINSSWSEAYDLIEAILFFLGSGTTRQELIKKFNQVLEKELSGYRLIDGIVVPITSEEELTSVDQAKVQSPNPVQEHLKQAIVLFADRENADYRNSIKESISAVEALCKLITNNPKATLADALKEIEKSKIIDLHSALKDSFVKLYGYSSDANGIRHALTDASNLTAEDARFMLVSCSAFINYLTEKAHKAGLSL